MSEQEKKFQILPLTKANQDVFIDTNVVKPFVVEIDGKQVLSSGIVREKVVSYVDRIEFGDFFISGLYIRIRKLVAYVPTTGMFVRFSGTVGSDFADFEIHKCVEINAESNFSFSAGEDRDLLDSLQHDGKLCLDIRVHGRINYKERQVMALGYATIVGNFGIDDKNGIKPDLAIGKFLSCEFLGYDIYRNPNVFKFTSSDNGDTWKSSMVIKREREIVDNFVIPE